MKCPDPRARILQGNALYPTVLVMAFVCTRFVQSVEPIQVLARPLIAFTLVTLAIQVLVTGISHNRAIAAYACAVFVLLIADPAVGALMVVAGVIPLLLALREHRRILPTDWQQFTALLNIVALVVLVFNAGAIVSRQLTAASSSGSGAESTVSPSSPDIYLVMLDGYPRADTLAADFDFDNGSFLTSAENLGFEVAEDSHSNYNATLLTLASMLNMEPAQAVVPGSPRPPDDERLLVRAVNHSVGIAMLRDLGYRIITIPSGISAFSLYDADEVLDTGQINSFEVTVARAGMLPLILPGEQNTWVHNQLRDRITASLDRLVALAAMPNDRPRFVFAHIMSPHAPILFGADGSPREGWGCFPQRCDPWGDNFVQSARGLIRDQVSYLNQLVLRTISSIRSGSARESVVVVFSDHGRRHDFGNITETIHNLFMSYTPGHPNLFPGDASPINILPRVLNAYADQHLPLASEESFVLDLRGVPTTGYFALQPWAP